MLLALIEKKLADLKAILQKQAGQYKETVMIGRTHGQHALPITLGFKFAVWGYEVNRHLERLSECKKRVLVGKISGAVGTQAGLGEHAEDIQALVMKRLGLQCSGNFNADCSKRPLRRTHMHLRYGCFFA